MSDNAALAKSALHMMGLTGGVLAYLLSVRLKKISEGKASLLDPTAFRADKFPRMSPLLPPPSSLAVFPPC